MRRRVSVSVVRTSVCRSVYLSVCLSVPSIDRRRRSAANAGSVMLRADDGCLRTTASVAASTYFENEMLFPLLIFLARSYRPPAFTAFVLEQVECRHFAVGSHHLERAFLVVLGRLRNTIQVQRDRSYRTATEPVETLN